MRFRESGYAAIKRKAEKVNMNFTEFVTAAAMNKPITVINGLEDVLKEQKAIGKNLNQLTTLCNMGKIVCPDLRELKEQYADMLTALNRLSGGVVNGDLYCNSRKDAVGNRHAACS